MASDEKNRPEIPLPTPGYALEVRLDGQLVVMVGGGRIARRKIPELLTAGARIHVVDPAQLPEIPRDSQLTHLQHSYQPTDLTSARLVFAATNDPLTNSRVAEDAAVLGILCCRADNAQKSDFITPARLLRPPLSISISSGGESPAMTSALRNLLAEMIPSCWQTATELAALIRRKVLTERPQIPYNQQVFLTLIEQGLFDSIEQKDSARIDRLLLKHFGAGFSLKDLNFKLPEGTP